MNTSKHSGATPERRNLRAGDWVEVRSKGEILRTLDKRGQLENMPFMPNMFEYCGKRLRVGKSAHKTCDTIDWTGARRVSAAVHLEGVRCSGKGYGGCQAGCLIFWKYYDGKNGQDAGIQGRLHNLAGSHLPVPLQ